MGLGVGADDHEMENSREGEAVDERMEPYVFSYEGGEFGECIRCL